MDRLDFGVTGRASVNYNRLLPTRDVLARYGICDRTLDRWISNEALGFPKPTMINKRRYFHERELVQFERNRASAKS
jgi:predicted DNA-binding transcriptional regulator AlpA